MHDIGIQCCFDPICYKTVETQTDQMENAFNVVSEKTSNKPLLPGQDGVQVSVKAEESKIKHDHSYAMKPPPYVIFPTYEVDSFNAISPPPLYDESVVGNENGDDSDDEDEDDDDDDARDNEDLDPHWLPCEEKFTDDDNLLSEDENDGECTSSTPDCEKKLFDSCLNKLLKRCPDCGDVIIQHDRKTIGSMLSIELTCQWPHHLLGFTTSGEKETLG